MSIGETLHFIDFLEMPKFKVNTKILKTEGINWKSGHICCEHWSGGMENDNNDLPNSTVPSTQLPVIEKYIKKLKKDTVN